MGEDMSDTVILSVKGINKTFGGLKALVDVSFDVYQGEIYGIIGPNGSGKTTLVNCITGFIKSDAGHVHFRDEEITRWPAHKIAKAGVTRTFQIMRPYYSLPAFAEGKEVWRLARGRQTWRQGHSSHRYS